MYIISIITILLSYINHSILHKFIISKECKYNIYNVKTLGIMTDAMNKEMILLGSTSISFFSGQEDPFNLLMHLHVLP